MRLKTVAEEMKIVGDMETLTTSYEQISVMKMQQVRAKVLSSRSFVDSLQDVFVQVRSSYKRQVEEILKKKKNTTDGVTFSTMANNGKDVVALLSANAKLYGDIIPKTFATFAEEVTRNAVDVCVVGLLGKEMLDESEIKKEYTYFEIPDNNITIENMKPLLAYLSQYKSVKVFYGKFENVISQVPQASIVSGQDALTKEEETTEKTYKFFYEPSLEQMLNFFETQFFSSFVQQTIHEHELARHASRIKAMEEALSNIHRKQKTLVGRKKRVMSAIRNAKQLQTLSGISLWKRNKI